MTSLQLGQVASWLVIESEQREGDESGSLTIISWIQGFPKTVRRGQIRVSRHRRHVYWDDAEAVERDDRAAPPRGAQRDPGRHCRLGGRARAAVSDALGLTPR